jgi:DNA-binding protein H-NS
MEGTLIDLDSMNADALIKLRADVEKQLATRRMELERQLAAFARETLPRARPVRVSKLAGRKVEPKYRGPHGELWSGRGVTPRWLKALLKTRKLDSFLIK